MVVAVRAPAACPVNATARPPAPASAARSRVPAMVVDEPATMVRAGEPVCSVAPDGEVTRRVAVPGLDSATCWAPLGPWRVRVGVVPAAAGVAETGKVQLEPAVTAHVPGVTDHPPDPVGSTAAMFMFPPDAPTGSGAEVW